MEILPLAITMMAGPQIISAVMLVTGERAKSASLAFIGAVALAASSGTLFLMFLFKLLGIDSLTGKDQGPLGAIVQTALIALLIVVSVRTYLGRAQAKPPKWMASLQKMGAKDAFKLGMTLILAMPSDLVIMTTVALHLVSAGAPFVEALPFIFATALVAASPLIFYIIFRKRAVAAMPGIREWMDKNTWVIQIVVYLIFIALLWG